MSYDKLFQHRQEEEIRRNLYIISPQKIDSLDKLKYYERKAIEYIKELESTIVTINEYRNALAKRSRDFFTANYNLLLSLKREKNYSDSKVFYRITIEKVFDNNSIHPETIHEKKYSGTERHKAFKEFEALQKQYPNIRTEKNTEKKFWEK
jgi:hypothetical protein